MKLIWKDLDRAAQLGGIETHLAKATLLYMLKQATQNYGGDVTRLLENDEEWGEGELVASMRLLVTMYWLIRLGVDTHIERPSERNQDEIVRLAFLAKRMQCTAQEPSQQGECFLHAVDMVFGLAPPSSKRGLQQPTEPTDVLYAEAN